MKQYVIDELRPKDHQQLKKYLDTQYGTATLETLYWVPIPPEQLSNTQKAHKACQPFYVAMDLAPDKLTCELLIRTRQRVKCDCIQYATPAQRNWVIQLVDELFVTLNLIS